MRLRTAILTLLVTLVGACSVANPDHCANQQGHASCAARDPAAPFCSLCVADNDGCVATPVTAICDAGESSGPASTSSPGLSETTAPTTTAATTTDTPTSSSTTTSGASEGLTTGDLTTGTSTSTTDATGTTPLDTSTGEIDTSTGEIDTTAGPMCGNDVQEPGETCDGDDLGQYATCTAKNPDLYGGGTLACVPGCGAYDESECCLATNKSCLLAGQPCCPGTSCQLLGMGLFTCKPV